MTDIDQRPSFSTFYRERFLPEHRHPANIAFHIVGVISSTALLIACLTVISPLWIIFWPLLFIGLGLTGHRLFERSEAVGDVRVLRTDYPRLWFLAGNFLLTLRVLSFGKLF